jgi:hypothetical protein
VEPSERYGTRSLEVLGDALGARTNWNGEFDSSAPGGRQGGIGSLAEIGAFLALLGIGIWRLRRLRRRRRGDMPGRDDRHTRQRTESA